MNIIEYSAKYEEDVKDLLVDLQEYIASIDREGYNIITDRFREESFKNNMKEIEEGNGIIFLACLENKIVGMIMGVIIEPEENYDFKAPKGGGITELIVSKKCRTKGIGQALLDKMENYFRSIGCERILIELFEYNDIGKNFYNKNEYFDRCRIIMKKI